MKVYQQEYFLFPDDTLYHNYSMKAQDAILQSHNFFILLEDF